MTSTLWGLLFIYFFFFWGGGSKAQGHQHHQWGPLIDFSHHPFIVNKSIILLWTIKCPIKSQESIQAVLSSYIYFHVIQLAPSIQQIGYKLLLHDKTNKFVIDHFYFPFSISFSGRSEVCTQLNTMMPQRHMRLRLGYIHFG